MPNITRDFYEKVLEALTDGVYFVDRDGRITYWNRAAEAITGYPRTEVLGRNCSDNILCHVNEDGCQVCIEGCPMARTMNRVYKQIAKNIGDSGKKPRRRLTAEPGHDFVQALMTHVSEGYIGPEDFDWFGASVPEDLKKYFVHSYGRAC